MTEDIENLILQWMRRLDRRLDAMDDQLGDVAHELRLRHTSR